MTADLVSELDEEFSGETFIVYHLYDKSCLLACNADSPEHLVDYLAGYPVHPYL
jgi:hypothetical protein